MSDDTATCPYCGGEAQRLGSLGAYTIVYRCRQCGTTIVGSPPPQQPSTQGA